MAVLIWGLKWLSLMLTSARRPPLAMPSIQSVHDYYLFAFEDGGRLAHVAFDLVDRLATLVALRRFPSIEVTDSRSYRYESYARMKEFVRRSTLFLFVDFLRMCAVSSCNVFVWVVMGRWVPISVMPCMRVVQLLLHASLLRGSRLLSLFLFFLAGEFHYFPCSSK
jgi:hypothetical protein